MSEAETEMKEENEVTHKDKGKSNREVDVAKKDQDDQVDSKGFAEYVLSTTSVKKKSPDEFSTASSYRKTLNSSDQDGEEPVFWTCSSRKDAEEYHMQHQRRGVALVFNHTVFNNMAPREGTKKDCDQLEKQLTRLGFEVRVHNDLKQSKVRSVLEETSKEDHSDADCLVVFVMSHGQPGHVFAKDLPYQEEVLWRFFTADNCSSLRGKPKLFFIQACRGDRVDSGVRVATDSTDSSPMSYRIPTEADILVAYSTVKEYLAWRSAKNGSWYVQALCEELRSSGQTRDLLTILTFVNRRVAIDFISNVPARERLHMKVQMPTFTSMLTRLVFFRQKTSEKSGKRKKISA